MGYRTTVILFNDQAEEWMKDPELGRKIFTATGRMNGLDPGSLNYGRVVECCHADTQTLAVVDSYNFEPISHDFFTMNEPDADRNIKLLRMAAEKLGFELKKKTKLPPPELTWLYTHCRAIGMDCKSDSGKWEHDIALYTINQKERIEELEKLVAQVQNDK
jgi:hypothetical protein